MDTSWAPALPPSWWPLATGSLLVLAGCGVTEVGTERVTVPEVSPTAIAGLPDANQEARIRIERGAFVADELVLLEGEPTVLTVVNVDGESYRFRIVETLLTAVEIPANTAVDVTFTSPVAKRYEGQLLSADGEEVIAALPVVVQSAGAVEP